MACGDFYRSASRDEKNNNYSRLKSQSNLLRKKKERKKPHRIVQQQDMVMSEEMTIIKAATDKSLLCLQEDGKLQGNNITSLVEHNAVLR